MPLSLSDLEPLGPLFSALTARRTYPPNAVEQQRMLVNDLSRVRTDQLRQYEDLKIEKTNQRYQFIEEVKLGISSLSISGEGSEQVTLINDPRKTRYSDSPSFRRATSPITRGIEEYCNLVKNLFRVIDSTSEDLFCDFRSRLTEMVIQLHKEETRLLVQRYGLTRLREGMRGKTWRLANIDDTAPNIEARSSANGHKFVEHESTSATALQNAPSSISWGRTSGPSRIFNAGSTQKPARTLSNPRGPEGGCVFVSVKPQRTTIFEELRSLGQRNTIQSSRLTTPDVFYNDFHLSEEAETLDLQAPPVTAASLYWNSMDQGSFEPPKGGPDGLNKDEVVDSSIKVSKPEVRLPWKKIARPINHGLTRRNFHLDRFLDNSEEPWSALRVTHMSSHLVYQISGRLRSADRKPPGDLMISEEAPDAQDIRLGVLEERTMLASDTTSISTESIATSEGVKCLASGAKLIPV